MKIYDRIGDFEKTGRESHVALGFFDGVHLGHQAVLNDCAADKGGCQAVALTFGESPARLLGKTDVGLITDNAEKARLMEASGIDAVIFTDFMSIRDMDAEAFIERVLHQKLRAKKVSCGYNYRFGKNGAGDTALLQEKCAALGIAVSVAEPVDIDGRAVSSTAVRELLQGGDIEGASRMLGRAYAVSGKIGAGNHLGSGMGFPTVNLPFGQGKVVPKYGVYASRVTVGGKTFRGATNIGVHPTVGENDAPVCETFLLDYDGGDIYGEDAVCTLVRFIREERRFISTAQLTAQVGRDIERIREILA